MHLISRLVASALGLVLLLAGGVAQAQDRPLALETRELAAHSLAGPRAAMGTGVALMALGPGVLLAGGFIAAAGSDGYRSDLHPAAIAVGATLMVGGLALLLFGTNKAQTIREARAEVARFDGAALTVIPGGAYLSARLTLF